MEDSDIISKKKTPRVINNDDNILQHTTASNDKKM
jgi:hypothetical protein